MRKKATLTRSLMAACSIVALTAVMYGCVHSGGDGAKELNITGSNTPAGATVEAGKYSTDALPADLVNDLEGYTGPTTAAAGESLTIGDYTFTCGAGSDCSVSVSEDGKRVTVEGSITVSNYVAPPPPPTPEPTPPVDVVVDGTPPSGWEPVAGMYTLQPGTFSGSNGIWFSCDSAGPACTVTVHENGSITADPNGGKVYAGLTSEAIAENERIARETTPMDIALPDEIPAGDEYMLADGALNIPAGYSNTVGGVVFSCAAGGPDCTVTVSGGMATSTGGMVTAQLTPAAQTALNEQKAAAGREANQKTALMTAAGAIDTSEEALSTQDGVDAARAAIVGLRNALDAAADVSDDDKATYQMQLTAAETAVGNAQDGIDLAANRESQMSALSTASTALASAITAIAGDATRAELDAAKAAKEDLDDAIAAAADLSDAEKAQYVSQAANAVGPIGAAETAVLAAEDEQRKVNETAQRKEDNKAPLLVADAITREKGGHVATPVSAFSALGKGTLAVPPIKDGGTPTITLRDTNGVKLDAMNTMSPGDGWTGKKFAFAKNEGAAFTNRSAPAVKVTEYGYGTFFDVANTGASTKLAGVVPNASGVLTLQSSASLKASQFAGTGALLPARPTSVPITTDAPTTPSTHAGSSFLGVQGTFTCTACTVKRTKDDVITIPGGTLTFTPTKSATQEFDDLIVMHKTSTPDGDYTQFGYWKATSGTGAKRKHTISTFAEAIGYGTDDNTSGLTDNIGALRGKATYSGAAAGIYVHEAGSGDDLVVSDGEFVADANLTAQFGDSDGTVSPAKQWAVIGTISGFQPATGDEDLSDWTLMLGNVNLGTRNAADADSNPNVVTNPSFSSLSAGDTSGGGNKGKWSVSFAGNAGPATTGGDNSDDYPKAAIGEFNGHFTNGHVAGAFGAEKD